MTARWSEPGRVPSAPTRYVRAVTCLVPLVFLISSGSGAYQLFWVLFGTSNQLLAALTLLGLAVWLRRSGRKSFYVMAPMAFVLVVTLWSLVRQVWAAVQRALATGPRLDAPAINGLVSALLIALAVALVVEAWPHLTAAPTAQTG